eukprot:Gb_25898 [translate_table: standard]
MLSQSCVARNCLSAANAAARFMLTRMLPLKDSFEPSNLLSKNVISCRLCVPLDSEFSSAKFETLGGSRFTQLSSRLFPETSKGDSLSICGGGGGSTSGPVAAGSEFSSSAWLFQLISSSSLAGRTTGVEFKFDRSAPKPDHELPQQAIFRNFNFSFKAFQRVRFAPSIIWPRVGFDPPTKKTRTAPSKCENLWLRASSAA